MLEASVRRRPALTLELGLEYLESFPEDALALRTTGLALKVLDRYPEAEAIYNRALSVCAEERRGEFLYLMGCLKETLSEFEEAERLHREAMVAAPHLMSSYIALGFILERRGQLDDAEALLRQATTCTEGDISDAYLVLGFFLRDHGRYHDALQAFRKVLALSPDYRVAEECMIAMEYALGRRR